MSSTRENAQTQNALTIASNNKVPAITDGWDATANDSTASPMKGSGIKFDKGAYYVGREKILIDRVRQFVAIDVREGWLFLKKDCPAEYVMRAIGGPKPPRPESYNVRSEWPDGLDGRPADPWKYARFLYLLDPLTAEVFTFTSSTNGGRVGIEDLAAQIQLMRGTRPGAVPIVELQSRQMKTKFGTTPRPFFQVMGWRVKSEEATKLISDSTDKDGESDSAETVNAPQPLADGNGQGGGGIKTVNAYDDDIPF